MFKRKLIRISAVAVAIALIAGSISGIAIYRTAPATKDDNGIVNGEQIASDSKAVNNEQSLTENLKFKIGELWRLSLNSNLDLSIKNSINKLNQSFDTTVLAKALKQPDESFDVIADEYLAALQMDLNFDLYINDREQYENIKSEAEYTGVILTIDMIDEYLNNLNAKEVENIVNQTNDEALNMPTVEVPNVHPEVPKAEDILPKNPADSIKAEIDNITNR